jgi:small subunit ribosomal protein S2
MKSLLETGVHFGHRTRRWNPKMRRYIFTERSGVHIIDLQQTIAAISHTKDLVREAVAEGGLVLFVGTKRQARDTIEQEALRCEMPYVNRRWLGGTLTNWRTIRQRIDYLNDLEARRDRGDFERLTKKEALGHSRQIEKLNERLGGIREMRGLPDLVFVVDVRREATAVAEANRLGIPIVAIVDTNCNPEPIDYVIPANDDAIRAIKLITSLMADAALEGLAQRKAAEPEAIEVQEILSEDEKYLSAATIARLRELTFEEEPAEAEQAVASPDASGEAAVDADSAAAPATEGEAAPEVDRESAEVVAEAQGEIQQEEAPEATDTEAAADESEAVPAAPAAEASSADQAEDSEEWGD